MVGIPLDPEALGDARCELDVDLHDLQQSSELRSQMFDPAGSTPWRPEIDEDENRSHRGENARLIWPRGARVPPPCRSICTSASDHRERAPALIRTTQRTRNRRPGSIDRGPLRCVQIRVELVRRRMPKSVSGEHDDT